MIRFIRNVLWFVVGVSFVGLVALFVNAPRAAEPTAAITGWAIVRDCTDPLGIAVVYSDGRWVGYRLVDLSDALKAALMESKKNPFTIRVCSPPGQGKRIYEPRP